jgi:hypothetical protein
MPAAETLTTAQVANAAINAAKHTDSVIVLIIDGRIFFANELAAWPALEVISMRTERVSPCGGVSSGPCTVFQIERCGTSVRVSTGGPWYTQKNAPCPWRLPEDDERVGDASARPSANDGWY